MAASQRSSFVGVGLPGTVLTIAWILDARGGGVDTCMYDVCWRVSVVTRDWSGAVGCCVP